MNYVCCVCGGIGCMTCRLRGYFETEDTNVEKITLKNSSAGQSAIARHPGSARFHALLAELGDLHDAKQRDYGTNIDPFANVRGSTEWGVSPWVGAMVRATDKVRRLQSFVANGTLRNEGVEDSLKDLAVYALIALVLYEEGIQEKKG